MNFGKKGCFKKSNNPWNKGLTKYTNVIIEKYSGVNSPHWKGGKSKRVCVICQKIFYKYPNVIGKTCGNYACICKLKSKSHFGKNLMENNANWKGNNITYAGLHKWIRKHKPKPDKCVCCKKKLPQDIANISGEYKKDINDFEWLCHSCHLKKDHRKRRIKNE